MLRIYSLCTFESGVSVRVAKLDTDILEISPPRAGFFLPAIRANTMRYAGDCKKFSVLPSPKPDRTFVHIPQKQWFTLCFKGFLRTKYFSLRLHLFCHFLGFEICCSQRRHDDALLLGFSCKSFTGGDTVLTNLGIDRINLRIYAASGTFQ